MRTLRFATSHRSPWIFMVFGAATLTAAPQTHDFSMALPPAIRANQGQMPSTVKYFAQARDYVLTFSQREVRLSPADGKGDVVITFPGSWNAQIEASDPLPFHISSVTGSDPRRWITNAQVWSRLRYRHIQPGVDLVFHPDGRADAGQDWEYDFEMAPGADPSRVQFDVRGAASLELDSNGDLLAHTQQGGLIRWHKPASYQKSGDGTQVVQTSFVVSGTRIGFSLGAWDRSEPLVIDPAFTFSTYFGGSSSEIARGIGRDSSGNIFICGYSSSGNLPTTRTSYQANYRGGSVYSLGDAYLAKFTSSGALSFVTYFGGTADDVATALALDSAGNVYVTGFTGSTDFPFLGGFQNNYGGSGGNHFGEGGDAFVAKFTPAGALVYSSYLGGSQDDAGLAIAVDASGNAYVAGSTLSPNFPASNGYQKKFGGTDGSFVNANGYVGLHAGDAFVAKISANGEQLLAATYLGGSLDESADAIALDSNGNVWVGGNTNSTNFPVVNPLQATFRGNSPGTVQPVAILGDGFISKLNANLTTLIYSTFLGGSGDDGVTGIVVDSTGSAYVTGLTVSANFPTTTGVTYKGPTTLAPGRAAIFGDAFVAKLNPAGNTLTYSTLLGGSDNEYASALAVDAGGNAYIAGMTGSSDFPVTGTAQQSKFGGAAAPYGVGDAFLAKFDPAGKVLYSSYLGGSSQDVALGLALDASGSVYIAGFSSSPNFPTATPFQANLTSKNGGFNAFLTVVSGLSSGPVLNAVTNIASYATGSVAPGEVVALFGGGLGPSSIVTAQLDPKTGLVTSELAGTRVLFDGIAAPLVYVLDSQLCAVAPYELAGKTSTKIVVEHNSVQSQPLTVSVVSAQPGLFSSDSSGHGQGAIYNQDSVPNSAAHPAAQESIVVLFGTGQGVTNPPESDGHLVTTVNPVPVPALPLTVSFDNAVATDIEYAGPIPELVAGFWQINVRLPKGLSSGTHQVVVSVGGAKSQANLTLAVH